jgi:transposase
MALTVLGIDISKKDFYVSLLTETRATKPKKFTNNTQGFESLQNWLKQQNVVELHACMEATSIYGEALAEFLYGEGFQVRIVNPARIKGFAKSELLTSIPGIGDLTASILLAEIGDVSDYDNARQLAAYAGLTPSERSSGTSVKGKTRLSCTGNVRMRKALYMPAVVAMRHNPLLKAMSERLLGRGKVKMQVIGALMRKLVHLAFGILKSQKPFDPNYAIATP